jgi:4-hydroxybenzoate polyprenyltransferase/phosphoserine phosphatase
MNKHPLIVDLDGTLIHTDLGWESLFLAVRKKPWILFLLPFWILRGMAFIKARLSEIHPCDPTHLPYNQDVLNFLKTHRSRGQDLVLASGSDQKNVGLIAEHLGIFVAAWGSDGSTNLTGTRKLQKIRQFYADKNFDYIGNDHKDLNIFAATEKSYLVSSNERLIRRARATGDLEQVFADRKNQFRDWLRMLRPHQWVKNILVFVPLIAAHQVDALNLAGLSVIAFIGLSFIASGTYILNDLLDMESDRKNRTKKQRPITSGRITVPCALVTSIALISIGIFFGFYVNTALMAAFAVYLVTTLNYSLWIKRLVLIDVLVLSGLYTLRIFAGAEATGIPLSNWLLSFSLFLFTSLAFLKRYVELQDHGQVSQEKISGRGYAPEDIETVRLLGIGCGLLSVIVLALYIDLREVSELYSKPKLLWFLCPLFLFWISHIWVAAGRGLVHQDPVLYAAKDRSTQIVALFFLFTVYLAS